MRVTSTLILLILLGSIAFAQDDKPEIIQPKEIAKRIISKKFTDVPSQVRSFHAIGTIRVLVTVNEAGNVEKASILSSFSHVEFMRKYIEKEVASWKFKPLKRNNKYIPFRGVISIPFYYGTFPKKMPRVTSD